MFLSLPRPRRAILAALASCLLVSLLHAADPGFPLTVKDALGTPVTLNQKPKAIVSLTLASDEILLDLVDASRIAAIDSLATDAGISNIAERAKAFPTRLSGDKEQIVAAKPDLVFVADWKEKEFVQALRDAKLTVFVFHTPSDFKELATLVAQLGALTGEAAKAKAIQARIDQRLAAVAKANATIPAAKRPTVLSWSFWGSTYGTGTSFDALCQAAGLVNVASKAGLAGWPQLSKEQVLALDPDLICLPSWSYDGKTDPAAFKAQFMADPVFATLKAVKAGRVYLMPDRHLQATSQYMADGVEDLARVAWPELFK